ncbi:MAG: peptidylprolyl isomerase [Gemmatimonadetes bacterium]|nr:peptidylprolyl isomerase [Gemmatimonadota bacterium]
MSRTPLLALCLAAVLPFAACGPGPLAEAGGNRFTVEHAARLIADNSTVPGDTQVVRAVAELWVDYTLLSGLLHTDTTLESLDVELATEQPLDELMLSRLREQVIDVDTVVTDAELTERFAVEMPGARATAAQILLPFPRSSTTRQRDSVLAVATALSTQIAAGADFAAMAARYSGDPGSGRRGGSMGTFGRGEMLSSVDSAVFSLRPGEVSDPVETGLGYHLLRLDALDVPELAEVGGEFRRRIQQERMNAAEAAYIARLDSVSGLRLAEGALEVTRALATATPSRLSAGAARRPLLIWNDGDYTAGDFVDLARNSPEGFAEGVLGASDDELETALQGLGQQALLLHEAESLGFTPSQAEIDSVSAEVRAAIRGRAEVIGLTPRSAGADGTPDTARAVEPATPEAVVEAALMQIVSGEQEIIPLGGVILLLRNQNAWRIDGNRIGATVARIEELLSSQGR